MPRRPGKTMETRAKSRMRRHGLYGKPPSSRGKKKLKKRWLVHALKGMKGYIDTDIP